MPERKIGVVLFQLGGPDSPEAIEPFLYNLFLDPDIIDFPLAKVGRPLLAKWISKGRSRKAREHYDHIGGRSPIREFTERQAEALEEVLRETYDARVFVAMRYWHPLTEAAIIEAKAAGCEELVLLPLYPQYSSTTTGSAINEWNRQCRRLGFSPEIHWVRKFFDYEPYLDSLVAQIASTLARFTNPEEVHVVYSAHNVPLTVIEAGDPYRQQIEETASLVHRRAGWTNSRTVCYQSKIGGRKWLRPSLHETIETLAASGTKSVLVVPVAFVSDHVETLSEIDVEAREQARENGIEQFEMMPGLNDSPVFIQALAGLVGGALGSAELETRGDTVARAASGAG